MLVMAMLLGGLTGLLVGRLSRFYIERYRRGVEASVSPAWMGRARAAERLLAPAFALLAGAWWWHHPTWAQFTPVLVVTGLLATVTVVDLAVRRIPNQLVLALIAWAVVQSLWTGHPTPSALVQGFLVGGGLFLVIAIVGRGAMGMGDVKLAAALGAVLGYPTVLSALFAGIVAGGVAALLLIASRRISRKDYMAYGPYLALGAILVLLG